MEIDENSEDISDENDDILEDTSEDLIPANEPPLTRKQRKVEHTKSNSFGLALEDDSEDDSEESLDLFTDVADHIKESEDEDGKGQYNFSKSTNHGFDGLT